MPLLDPLSSVTAALQKDNVIPDVVPQDFMPSLLFSVTWGEKEAMLGNELTKADTQSEPRVQLTPMGFEGEEVGGPSYTLAMVDPDAPSLEDPKFRSFRHWVVSGLRPPTPGEVVAAASAAADLLDSPPDPLSASSSKPAITPYRPPGPGPGTKRHRYVFLLFQEPSGGLTLPPDAPEYGTELEMRRCWSASKFAERHNLTLVGANYFTLVAD